MVMMMRQIAKLPSQRSLNIWKNASAVCFDVDSTVITEEGIDMLAEVCGKGLQVSQWTSKAMGGDVPFEDALRARLEIIKPSKNDLDTAHKERPPKFSPGIKKLFSTLQHRNIDIFLVSGGFTHMIEPIAEILNIPKSRIYANEIIFDETTGDYVGFNAEALTSCSGGKASVLKKLKHDFGYKNLVMCGDGVTDLEAKAVSDLFIGYGGIVEREIVKDGSDWFIYNMFDLVDAIDDGSE